MTTRLDTLSPVGDSILGGAARVATSYPWVLHGAAQGWAGA